LGLPVVLRLLFPALQERINQAVRDMVHESVRDTLKIQDHVDYIQTRLAMGLLSLMALPFGFAMRDGHTAFTLVAIFLMGLSLAELVFVSRTGQLKTGYLLSSMSFAALLAWVGLHTGNVLSPVMIWIPLIILEAAMSLSRRVTLSSCLVATLIFAFLAADFQIVGEHLIGTSYPALTVAFIQAGAMIYGLFLALRLSDRLSLQRQLLHNTHQQLESLENNVGDVLLYFNAQGQIIKASDSVQELYAISPIKLTGSGLIDYIHVADRPAYLNAFYLARQNRTEKVEVRLKAAHEMDYRWVEITLPALPDDEAHAHAFYEPESYIGFMRDIASRHAYEASLKEAHDKLLQMNEAKSRFLANMSHELRTPLNAIIGFADMLAQGIYGPLANNKQVEYVSLIQQSGKHLCQVVNDILDVSKIETGHFVIVPEAFDCQKLMQDVLKLLAPSANEKNLSLKLTCKDDLPELKADQRAFKQIMLNVISNAIKFSHPDEVIHISVYRKGSDIVARVADNGIGIEQKHLHNLGRPFYQADTNYDRSHGGAGLGLSVVKGLIALHDGRMVINSEYKRGTTVTLSFPIAGAKPRFEDSGLSEKPVLLKDHSKGRAEPPALAVSERSRPSKQSAAS
jgi:cell cycle sensor histidine kinase DivJ